MSSKLAQSLPIISDVSTRKKSIGGHKNGDNFQESFYEILKSIPFVVKTNSTSVINILEHLKEATLYNVPQGKRLRGRMVVQTYQELVENPTEENLRLACLLGWIVEILQASFLIADDIMDNGITRRGRPCWYLVNNKGNSAFNDALMLEHLAYQLLRKYFGHMEVYTELLDLVLNLTFKTILGEALDTTMANSSKLDEFNQSTYDSIVTYKTAYYTIYLPVTLAMTLAGISSRDTENKYLWEDIKSITLKLGTLFQIQDDFLDCFAEENVLGKLGTDIQEGKCTWLFVTAKGLCNKNEFEILKTNYGSYDAEKVVVVKKLYVWLGLQNVFNDYQEKLRCEIIQNIDALKHHQLRTVLKAIMKIIYKRQF